ncbi:hypothetical protein [Sphingobacterium sp. NPDC055431]
MKKSLIILALLPLLFFGCKKGGSTDEPKPEEKLYEVKFSANPFDQEIKPMNLKSTTSNNIINQDNFKDMFGGLYYFIYDESGKNVASGASEAIGPNYNDILNFNVKLPKGKFSLAVVGAPALQSVDPSKLENVFFTELGTNTFSSEIKTINVEKDSTYSPIKLSRISSSIKVNIKDISPNEEVTLELRGNVYGRIYPFSTNYSQTPVLKSFGKIKTTPNSANHFFDIILFPQKPGTTTSINLEVLIFNNSNVLIGTKSIPGVVIKSNHKTILTGNVFDVLDSPEKKSIFKAEIVGDFSPEIINQTF